MDYINERNIIGLKEIAAECFLLLSIVLKEKSLHIIPYEEIKK